VAITQPWGRANGCDRLRLLGWTGRRRRLFSGSS